MAKINKGYLKYEVVGPSVYAPAMKDSPTVNALPGGTYKIKQTQQGAIYFEGMSVVTDDLVDLPNTVSSQVLDEIKEFWSDKVKERYKKYGMIHKRGILLEGPAGTGKSITLIKVMNIVEKEGGIAFFNPNPLLLHAAAEIVREIQPTVPLLAVYEEFDQWLDDSSSMLSMLDGEMAIDNLVVLATTNYIEKIPARVKNRPSRFATVVHVGPPNAATRKKFLAAKLLKNDAKFIDEIVEKTDGFVIDQLKDVIVSTFCLGLSVDDAILKIKQLSESGLGAEDIESMETKRFVSEKQKQYEMMRKKLESDYRSIKKLGEGEFQGILNNWTIGALAKSEDDE